MLVLITYFSTGLNDLYIYKFWELLFIVQLSYFLCNFYALFLASLAKNPSNIAILNVVSNFIDKYLILINYNIRL